MNNNNKKFNPFFLFKLKTFCETAPLICKNVGRHVMMKSSEQVTGRMGHLSLESL